MRAGLCWGGNASRVPVLALSPKRSLAFAAPEKFMPARAPASTRKGACAPRKAVDASLAFTT